MVYDVVNHTFCRIKQIHLASGRGRVWPVRPVNKTRTQFNIGIVLSFAALLFEFICVSQIPYWVLVEFRWSVMGLLFRFAVLFAGFLFHCSVMGLIVWS